MASSNHGGGSQLEPPQEKAADTTPPPPPQTAAYPPHMMPPPPPMGYPPHQNPHGYPPGYAFYTNGYPTGGYNYPPNNPYYGHPVTYQTSSTATRRFYRSFILCCCVMLTCLFLASLVVALVLRPAIPVYKVTSMSVTNFSTAPSLVGEWDTKVVVENPNEKLTAYFSDFKVDVMYKDGLVAINYAPGFVLNTKDAKVLEVKGRPSEANEALMDKNTLDDMAKERDSGGVMFSLRVSSVNMYKSGSISTRSNEIVAICEGLKVVFHNATGNLDSGGKPIQCLVYI